MPRSLSPLSLSPLFEEISVAQSEKALRLTLMDNLSHYFGVQRWGLSLFDANNQLVHIDKQGVSDSFVDTYEQYGRAIDPVLEYVLNYHAPAHEELVLAPGTWKQSQLYRQCCSTQNHEHIMTGPILSQGQVVGTINFARIGHAPAFNQLDLACLGAVCSHASIRLSELRRQPAVTDPAIARLTTRELQIARLVAKGLTNSEIGAELWIARNSVKQALKRMFRKLDVSSRTEMVVKLHAVLHR